MPHMIRARSRSTETDDVKGLESGRTIVQRRLERQERLAPPALVLLLAFGLGVDVGAVAEGRPAGL